MSDSSDTMPMVAPQIIMRFTNLMAYLASPRSIARVGQMPTQAHLLEHTGQYLDVLDALKRGPEAHDKEFLVAAEPYVRKLRALFLTWTPSTDVPTSIQEIAREFLTVSGFGTPLEVWDAFEGAPEERDPPPRERSAPPGPFTWDDYLGLMEDDPRELIAGHWVAVEPPQEAYAGLIDRLCSILVAWADAMKIGFVRRPGLKLKLGPQTGVRSDLQLYLRGEPDPQTTTSSAIGLPDLIIELLSPSRERFVFGTKLTGYRTLAIPEVWIVEAERQLLLPFAFDKGNYAMIGAWSCEHIFCPSRFPGLEIPLAQLWKP